MFSDPRRRLQRQEEALARKAERAVRSPEEQLAVLAARGVTSGREYNRLRKERVAKITGKKKADK